MTNDQAMATVREEIVRLQELARSGKGDEKIHIVRVEQIQAERAKNEKSDRPKTKFIWETHSAHLYTLLHIEKERIVRRVGNLSIAFDLMLRAWQELDDEKIKAWLSEGE